MIVGSFHVPPRNGSGPPFLRRRHETLTGREAKVLELPKGAFSSRQPVERGWGDEELSDEQLRT